MDENTNGADGTLSEASPESTVENNDVDVSVAEDELENEGVEGDDKDSSSESDTEDNDELDISYDDDEIISGDDESAARLANQAVLKALESDPEGKAAYQSQLKGLEKLQEQKAQRESQLAGVVNADPAAISELNQIYESKGLVILDASDPKTFLASVRQFQDEQVAKGRFDEVVFEFPESLDPNILALQKELQAQKQVTNKLLAETKQKEAIEAFKPIGEKWASAVKAKLGADVPMATLLKAYQAGARPTTVDGIVDAIGRVDFDTYKGLSKPKEATKATVPPSATGKTSSKTPDPVSLSEMISDPRKWRQGNK